MLMTNDVENTNMINKTIKNHCFLPKMTIVTFRVFPIFFLYIYIFVKAFT